MINFILTTMQVVFIVAGFFLACNETDLPIVERLIDVARAAVCIGATYLLYIIKAHLKSQAK